jgi:glutamate carboxypeptidase
MEDTPARIGKIVHARFEGKGTKKILLLAHMDTVYLRGMLATVWSPYSSTPTRK